MSDNANQEEQLPPPLVEEVSEFVSTDVIQELKSGVFNLYISLYHHMTVRVGPVEAMKYCILYLQEIIDHFQESLDSEKAK
jgi:hypothetical protein